LKTHVTQRLISWAIKRKEKRTKSNWEKFKNN